MRKIFNIALLMFVFSACEEPIEEIPYLSVTGSTSLDEAYDNSFITLELSERLLVELEVNIELSGTATEGVDFLVVPDKIRFPAGYVSIGVPIATIDNGLYDGIRSLDISFSLSDDQTNLVEYYPEELETTISITDDETLLSIESDSSLPLQMILKRRYSDLVEYEVTKSPEFTSTSSLIIEDAGTKVQYELYLRPMAAISAPVDISLTLFFEGVDHNESFTGSINLTGQEDKLIFIFEKDGNLIKEPDNG